MNLTITPIRNNKQQTFGAVKVYKELKQIPNLTCACCGKKMIPADSLEKAIQSISQPLLALIKKGTFTDLFKDISIAKLLSELAVKHPKDSLDKIITNEECHKKVTKICREKYLAVKLKAQSELRSANVVLKRIASFREYMSEDEKEIYDLFCAYAKENRRMRLSEIVQLDNVQQTHTASSQIKREKNKKLNDLHLNRIENIIKKNNPEIEVNKITEELKKLILTLDISN